MSANQKTIVLTGGGTLGSVTPLLALAEILSEYQLLFIGTETGVEKQVVQEAGLSYQAIVGGKLRRYWSWRNFIDPWLSLYGLIESCLILAKTKPALIISAGSYISVPVIIAGKILGIPSLILQLDAWPGLANRIMSKFTSTITLSFEGSKKYFKNGIVTGCPIRRIIKESQSLDRETCLQHFGFTTSLPTVLVLGGGTGSSEINKLVLDNLYHLTQICQVIHSTGKNKDLTPKNYQNYYSSELLSPSDMAKAYQACDLVVSRAGMGVLCELSHLSKAVILLPLPRSHQEINARYFQDQDAALVLSRESITAREFVALIKSTLNNQPVLQDLGANIHQALPNNQEALWLKLITQQK